MNSVWPESAVIMPCDDGQLVGILHYSPEATPGIGVLIVVGGPQYRVGSHRQFVLMARRIAAGGYPVLRFDYRGMGDSTGAPRTFDAVDQDIRAAIDALISETPTLRMVVVLGLCDAASAALIYSHSDARVGGLVLINPWARTDAGEARTVMRHYYLSRLVQRSFWSKVLSGAFKPQVAIGGLLKTLRQALYRGDRQSRPAPPDYLSRMTDGAMTFRNPVLLMLSGHDLTAREFENYCAGSPAWTRWLASGAVTRVPLHDADHTFSASESLLEASRRILQWLGELASRQGG